MAVVPVIGFHGGLNFLSGGFVGVDVFFVISGFLITGIIMSELENGTFSIARFYERRARRILPALTLVIVCCLPFAWLWMIPSQLASFGRSVVAVSLFVSNVLFWSEQGYFAPAAETKPLLHTWSLAVEEQYYVLFPLALFLLWRFGRKAAFGIILLCALFSFFLCEWGWRHAPTGNFYLAPSRAWELLAGSICAYLSTTKHRQSSGLSAIGLGLILIAVFTYDRATPFPSFYALVPVVGTALILLYATGNTWTGRLLGSRPLVGIGLISYSAYLWHQPLFAFARIRTFGSPPPWLMLTLSVLSLALAYVSWRFVEMPFRRAGTTPLPSRGAVFRAASFAISTLVAVGVYGQSQHGLSHRFDGEKIVDTDAGEAGAGAGLAGCVQDYPSLSSAPCVVGDARAARIAVFGDSHATQWLPAFVQLSRSRGWQFHLFTKVACPAAWLDVWEPSMRRTYQECSNWRSQVLPRIASGKFDAVIITSATFSYTDRARVHPVSPAQWAGGLSKTFRYLQRSKMPILYIVDNPHYPVDPLQCTQLALHLGYDPSAKCGFNSTLLWDEEARAKEALVVHETKATSLNIDSFLCSGHMCSPYRNGMMMMRDKNHLSAVAVQSIGDTLGRKLDDVLMKRRPVLSKDSARS